MASLTHVGRIRDHNEDAFLVRDLGSGAGGEAWLLVVADGMGGMAGGEIASRETVEQVSDEIEAWPSAPLDAIRRATVDANLRLRDIVSGRPELFGMGTTLVMALARGGQAWLGNVGDSRAYLVRGGQASRITEDHSWVAERVRAGLLTEAQAAVHPQRNIITRSVGSEPHVEPDVFGPLKLLDGDVILLCSDGLYEVVPDDLIARVCSRLPVGDAAEALVDAANANGGPDNVTVILARYAAD